MTTATPADTITLRIEQAERSGVIFSAADKDQIRRMEARARELRAKANSLSTASSDPLNKGNAFPMGVGFTRESKRSNQRIDASVRRAGEAVAAYKSAEAAEKAVDAMLAGKGTTADRQNQLVKRENAQRGIVKKLLTWKRGDSYGTFTIERINRDRDGYPVSFNLSGGGIVKGVHDKIDVVRELFHGDRDKLVELVDSERAASITANAAPLPTESPSVPVK